MILRGILDNSLSGQLCIRGFAYIKDLAKVSEADYSYQRDPIKDRTDIIDFLETENYLFFPEIILGYKIKHSFQGKGKEIPPLQKLRSSQKYVSNVDDTMILVKTVDFKDSFDSRGVSKIAVVEMYINDDQKVFHRIDGNHRLKAAESVSTSKVNSMTAPFCIILGEEFYEDGKIQEHSDTKAFEKNLKVYFHNINTKTIPLTSEENLKVIIDDSEAFRDEEILTILNREGYLTRLFLKKHNPDNWNDFFIKDSIRSVTKRIFQIILRDEDLSNKEDSFLIKKVFDAFNYTITLFEEDERFLNCKNNWLFKTIVYYKAVADKQKVNRYLNWIFQNRLHEVKEIITESAINIFDNISSKTIEVFVAMPFFDEKQVESHSEIYSSVIKKIKKEHDINIKLHKPMIHEGETFDMIDDIFRKIKNCNIFISNITGNNPNVTYEMGWARALGIPTIIIREKDAEEPKSDYRNDLYFTYQKDALEATLKKDIYKHIVAVLNKSYGFSISTEK